MSVVTDEANATAVLVRSVRMEALLRKYGTRLNARISDRKNAMTRTAALVK
jgi:hypothetical protein